MLHPPNAVPDWVVPGDVYMVPFPINRNHAPRMVHAVAGDKLTGDAQLIVQKISICMGIAVADCKAAYQRAICGMGIGWELAVLPAFLVISAVQNKIVMEHQRLFCIRHGGIHPFQCLLCRCFQFLLLPLYISFGIPVANIFILYYGSAGIIVPAYRTFDIKQFRVAVQHPEVRFFRLFPRYAVP